MSTKLILPCVLAAALLLLAACGRAGSSGAPQPSAAAGAGRPSQKFVATLTGHADPSGGARRGVGVAVIALHDAAHEICWRFAHLHGFTAPTRAEIRRGAGRATGPVVLGLSSGSRLRHRGCARARPSLMAAIAQRPDRFYVNVAAAGFPSGAVGGRL